MGYGCGVEMANLLLQSVWEAARYQGDWISRLLSMQAAVSPRSLPGFLRFSPIREGASPRCCRRRAKEGDWGDSVGALMGAGYSFRLLHSKPEQAAVHEKGLCQKALASGPRAARQSSTPPSLVRWRVRAGGTGPRPGQAPLCSPPPADGVWMPGARDVHARKPRGQDCSPSDPGSCSQRLQSAPRPQPALSPPLPSGHRHLRPRAPAEPRDPRAPPAEHAPLPPRGRHPAALGPGPLLQRHEARRRRNPQPRGVRARAAKRSWGPARTGGARLGAGKPEAPERPLKPASPWWPAVVRGSRVSVPALAAAVSGARQVRVRGVHRGHAASRPSVSSSRSRHRIPKFPQVQRED